MHCKQSKDAGHNLKKLWLVSTTDLMAIVAIDLTTLLKGNEDMADSTNTKPRRKHSLLGVIDLPQGRWNRVLYLVPVAFVLLYGASWIAIHAHQARGFTHPLFQCLALTENVIALLLRRRKPIGALAGILAVYVFVDLEPTTLLPVLLSLFTVIVVSTRRVTVGLSWRQRFSSWPRLLSTRIQSIC